MPCTQQVRQEVDVLVSVSRQPVVINRFVITITGGVEECVSMLALM